MSPEDGSNKMMPVGPFHIKGTGFFMKHSITILIKRGEEEVAFLTVTVLCSSYALLTQQ